MKPRDNAHWRLDFSIQALPVLTTVPASLFLLANTSASLTGALPSRWRRGSARMCWALNCASTLLPSAGDITGDSLVDLSRRAKAIADFHFGATLGL